MKLVIPDIPPSNNKFMGRGTRYTQSIEYQEEKVKWEWLVRAAVGRNKPRAPIPISKVTLIYYFPTRHRRDPDNYSGKFILDGLVKAGVIKDDSFQCIDLKLIGRHDKDNPRTVIKIRRDGQ